MFNTKGIVNNQQGTSKYISPGQYLLKINKIATKTASSGNSQLLFEVETEPITTQGFTPVDGHTGQIGTVKTVYISNPDMEQQVATLISLLADALEVREQVDNIPTGLNLDQYVEALSAIVCNGNYVWMTINGKGYVNQTTGKTGVELQFPKYKMFASKSKYETLGATKALANVYVSEPKPAQTTATTDQVW